ncbi:Uma2 family endonuclease [Paramuricea clavata]|uniref:Uma2 family endonuclease n=1 Tax=Paramuricea clavata TaxID=317549 RepID=A0A7D9JPN4_PARCT|nr:Uma2 family endonuclease [Paramuricea clavata]
MAMWIAFIWFLSSFHPVKNIFTRNENDANAKPGIALVLVLFTAVVYGKTYFALRKQARSMIGRKTTFSSKQSQYAPNKSSSIESETCVGSNNHVKNGIERDQSLDEPARNQNHRAEKQNVRAQFQYERDEIENECAKSQNERGQSLVERAENKNRRAQNQYEGAEIENLRAESQSERDQSLNERAENQHNRAEKQNDRAQNPYERAEIENERAKSHNQRAQNKNEHVESENERAQREDLSSNKRPKNFRVINNTKEQKFLNTIIIIACIAVVTVMPGTMYSLLRGTGVSSDTNSILAVGSAIFSLNFAANPFVYCLRLKRYRKTFKMVYGCKH